MRGSGPTETDSLRWVMGEPAGPAPRDPGAPRLWPWRWGRSAATTTARPSSCLEPLSDSVVRVTHRDQVSYFGFNRKWEPSEPYTWAAYEGYVYADGIDGSPSLTYRTPDGALRALCPLILKAQRREDARRINPKERKRAARQVLAEFMNELAD